MKNLLLIFNLLAASLLSCSVKAAVTIDSVKTATSTCANNGSMIIYAQTTSGTLLYAITTGPSTYPVQTANNFSSLAPGVYTVEVSNTSNETQTTTVTITGNYQLPDFIPGVVSPSCPDSSSGSIIGNLSFSTGVSPYLWELVAPSPITRPQQLNDTMYNLPAGNYTIRLTDGCNNVQTKTVILFAAPVSMTFFGGFARITGCDTVELAAGLFTSAYRPPYKITYTVGGSSYTIDTAKVSEEAIFNGYPYVFFTVPNMSYGGLVDNITITNSCGVQAYIPQLRVCPFELVNTNYTPISIANCQNGLLTNFAIGNASCNMSVYPKFPLTVTIRDIPANNVVEVKTYHNPADFSFATTALLPGASYNITMVDSCNNSHTTTLTTPLLNRYVSLGMNAQQTLLDSTVIASLFAVGFPTQGTTMTVISGPVSLHSTKPKYAYSENYIYPKTFSGSVGSDSSTMFQMANAGPGTYTYIITDSCGNQFPGSFTVLPSDVASFHYTYNYQKGCVGSSGLQYEVKHNTFTTVTLTDIATSTIVTTLPGWQMNQNPFTNVVNNIRASDYEFKLDYYFVSGVANAMNNILIDVFTIRDTIHVTPYQNPALKTTAVSSCSGQLFLALIADSSKGIPPYQYEITSGPQVFPPQASNIFQLILTGNYTIRLIDSCGNSVSTNVTVNPLVFPPLAGLGNICANDSAQLTYGASTYFAYTWTKPNGSTYAGDTLFINPVTPADTGVYTIKRITTINGCSNTETTTYRLSLGKQDSTTASICLGQTYTFGSRILSIAGVYRDTFSTASCDSISILKLVVNAQKRDSATASICAGQTYSFGSRILSTAGVYRDTFPTASCDSISILNLTVNAHKTDSTTASICVGQTYSFGSRILSIAGVYRDTFPTASCDSISILNLTVNAQKRDSATASICAGQTYSFGSRILSTAGVYRDTFQTASCDSISILNLTVNAQKRDSTTASICVGQTYSFGSRILSTAGVYRDTFPTASCDSISILNLTVNAQKKDSTTASICVGQTYSFGSRILSIAGVYRDTFPTASCDSISILNLTVNAQKRDSTTASICIGQTYSFGSRTLSIGGVYRDTFPTASCDSISILKLVVNAQKRDSTTASICVGQTYSFGSRILSIAGVYRDTFPTGSCDSISILNLSVYQLPAIQVQSDHYIVTAGETVHLSVTPSNLANYLWTSLNGLNTNNSYNPSSIVNQPSWYYVTVTDANNCSKSDSLFISLRPDSILTCDDIHIISIPTAFTPNNDRWNNEFRILGINNIAYKSYHLTIYNRWGELVFESEKATQAWDGTYKGKPASVGNYVYIFQFTCSDGKRVFNRKGNILLLR